MSVIDKLETVIAGWVRPAPHLPTNGQKWLAENVWWLAIIAVVASVFGILTLIGTILTYLSFVGVITTYYSTSVYGSGWIIGTLLTLAATVAITVLTAMAIMPLQRKEKKGWRLLFMSLLVSALSVVVGAVMSLDLGSFIVGIVLGGVVLAIGAYFLFEIRSYFTVGHRTVRGSVQ